MKLAALLSLCALLALSSAAITPPLLFGTCVEMCSSSLLLRSVGYRRCAEGYECMSNGCGHTCQPVLVGKRACGPVCDIYCIYGNVMVNGCPTCACNRDPLIPL
ncbi:uncharacterized protein LOC131927834 [Physella acuta]|uniref:uncharacterized protein LOC131927834 n=1 Tax=Physella acuta TaxID=109671 RepID=UPI0027DC821D|nr:uncharacterized protein LOC131927834 [Physella acuta]